MAADLYLLDGPPGKQVAPALNAIHSFRLPCSGFKINCPKASAKRKNFPGQTSENAAPGRSPPTLENLAPRCSVAIISIVWSVQIATPESLRQA
jgi:hypothetical protein